MHKPFSWESSYRFIARGTVRCVDTGYRKRPVSENDPSLAKKKNVVFLGFFPPTTIRVVGINVCGYCCCCCYLPVVFSFLEC